jgi:hypothetical protein
MLNNFFYNDGSLAYVKLFIKNMSIEDKVENNFILKKTVFEYTKLAKLLSLLELKNSDFVVYTYGKWGDCTLPSYNEYTSIDMLQDDVIKFFPQVEKYGGVYFFIIPVINPSIFLSVSYRKDIGLHLFKSIENIKYIKELSTKNYQLFV